MNAIILAAGTGSRLFDITENKHKALLSVDGIPNIERTISYLVEFGIIDIHIVTGHMSHLFFYLKEKYGCNLIFNQYYSKYNNIYSFASAQNYFTNTWVIDADVILLKNIFQRFSHSCYYLIQRPASENKEWVPSVDKDGTVTEIMVTNKNNPSLLGISFWIEQDCEIIRGKLHNYLNDEKLLIDPKLYWDNIPASSLSELNIRTFIVPEDSAAEIDNMNDYQRIYENCCKQDSEFSPGFSESSAIENFVHQAPLSLQMPVIK